MSQTPTKDQVEVLSEWTAQDLREKADWLENTFGDTASMLRTGAAALEEVTILNDLVAEFALQAKAKDLLEELVAIVRGEAPSLLNEDSGGFGELSCRIDNFFTPLPAPPVDATGVK